VPLDPDGRADEFGIARIAMKPRSGSRRVGAIINPTNAVNTASAITRGFINVTKLGGRSTKLGREANEWRDNGIAVVFMVIDSSSQSFVCEIHYLAVARIDLAASLTVRTDLFQERELTLPNPGKSFLTIANIWIRRSRTGR
jgi:hypothetical protein